MIATKIMTTVQNSDIVRDIMHLADEAEMALIEGMQEKFTDITYNMQICAIHAYSELSTEITKQIFNLCWELGELESLGIGGMEIDKLIQEKAFNWNKQVKDTCKHYLV